jgi:ubiquinone/menaquinone biosynthesis C-methylase UbiE
MYKNKNLDMLAALATPDTLLPLGLVGGRLMDSEGSSFEFSEGRANVIDFMSPFLANDNDKLNLDAYNSPNSVDVYRNFLDWLFLTFDTNEIDFRNEIISLLKLSEGQKVLIVSCGLGEDISLVRQKIGITGEIHAQDISKAMVLASAEKHLFDNIFFTISNANSLPYQSDYFDAVFHFGGINLFGNIKRAISELNRVCKKGGRVVFGDEGIAEHLIGTEYYEIAVCNNKLWAKKAPMADLPHGASDIQLNYYLGNCFYLVSFTSGDGFPHMNIDVPHKGTRGGTARTRYFGKLEGVTEGAKLLLHERAKLLNISVHDLLELMLKLQLNSIAPNIDKS